MEILASLNGEKMPLSQVKISAMDRGFLFGDAVYEVARVYGGKPFLWEAHLARLRRSLEALAIRGVEIPRVDARVKDLIATSGEKEALVYLQISRGAPETRTHNLPTTPVEPTEFLYVQPFGDPNRDKRREGASAITHPDLRWSRVDIKSVNLLGNVLASEAARAAGALEAILVSRDGEVTEGSHTNVFAVIDGVARTMPLSHQVLPGVSRDFVLGLARDNGVKVAEKAIKTEELNRAEEIFLTGTTAEVMPIVRLNGRPVGDGTPGPITRKLQGAFAEALKA